MKIKAFSFEKDSITLAAVKNDVISEISENSVYFDSFSDPNQLFKCISQALETSEVLLIGVETGYYLKFKPVLIKAFNLSPSYSEKIDNAIGSEILEEKLRKAHSLVPENAVELISDPSLFFLDEPTSGLDPEAETNLMHQLRGLSEKKGKTVIVITHTLQNIDIFDKIIFLAPGGKLCFYGTPKQAQEFFQVDNLTDAYEKISKDINGYVKKYNSAKQKGEI